MKRLFYYMTLMAAMLLNACSSDETIDTEQPLPEGMGRLRIAISTPEGLSTRAVYVNPWEAPDHDWEKLQSFRILICSSSNVVQYIIDSGTMQDLSSASYPYRESAVITQDVAAGTYKIYATANYADGYTVGSAVNPDATVKFANGYSETNIPMTGKLSSDVTVAEGAVTDAGTITVWRVMGKLSFEFTNETSEQVQILGIEVEPINQASTTGSGIYLFSKDNLASEANLVPLFPANTTKTVSATWALDDVPTQGGAATVSLGGVFESTKLSWGSKLETTGSVTTFDNVYKLQKYKTTENVLKKLQME